MEKQRYFEGFFKENYTRFYLFALQIIEDQEVCRDIVSDAFGYAWEKYDEIEVNDWTRYIYSYIRNKCISHLRHKIVEQKYIDAYIEITEDVDYLFGEDHDEWIEMIRKAMKTLPERTQTVLTECYVNNKKYKEVAEEMNISTNAVKKHIVKALKTIKSHVLPQEHII